MTSKWHHNRHESFEALHEEALARVRAAYEAAASLKLVRLEVINRARSPSAQYRSIDELVSEYLSGAGAVCDFAVNLGLITPDEAREIIVEFFAAHPELGGDDDPVPPE